MFANDTQARLTAAAGALTPEAVFREALTAVMPQLRLYARSLSGSADTADDLVQETMVRAWGARTRFIPGTNMRAWTHVILRNVYFSLVRRARFGGECSALEADLILAMPARQEAHVELGDLARAMEQLPHEQREALLMMGAGGLTCEEVAVICGCPVGTVKSRVARARAALRGLLDGGQLAQRRADVLGTDVSVLDQIMQAASQAAVLHALKPALQLA
jgi:RNA polymerase sigma-70 factor (ECF subfamily)